jgi:hypothetical protein
MKQMPFHYSCVTQSCITVGFYHVEHGEADNRVSKWHVIQQRQTVGSIYDHMI